MRRDAASDLRVLVVDDEPLGLAAIEAVLAPLADVETALSGPAALEALARDEFACVLLDVNMPGMDGFETARLIKQRPGSRHVPIIFLTGRLGEEEVRRGYALGAVDYLLKPFEPEILQAKVAVFVDLARLRREAQILGHRLLHDPLTGLPNRTLFLDRLELALARIAREPAHVAVLFLDLDGFKNVNDSRGHHVGDLLLVEVAARLRHAIRTSDTAARFGGDEFLVLCEHLPEMDEAEQLAGRVRESLAEPYALEGADVHVTASVGVAATDDPSVAPEELIRLADEAMLREKSSHRNDPVAGRTSR
jgi:diguanylate cyclase (GGDEF)-like protein